MCIITFVSEHPNSRKEWSIVTTTSLLSAPVNVTDKQAEIWDKIASWDLSRELLYLKNRQGYNSQSYLEMMAMEYKRFMFLIRAYRDKVIPMASGSTTCGTPPCSTRATTSRSATRCSASTSTTTRRCRTRRTRLCGRRTWATPSRCTRSTSACRRRRSGIVTTPRPPAAPTELPVLCCPGLTQVRSGQCLRRIISAPRLLYII